MLRRRGTASTWAEPRAAAVLPFRHGANGIDHMPYPP